MSVKKFSSDFMFNILIMVLVCPPSPVNCAQGFITDAQGCQICDTSLNGGPGSKQSRYYDVMHVLFCDVTLDITPSSKQIQYYDVIFILFVT